MAEVSADDGEIFRKIRNCVMIAGSAVNVESCAAYMDMSAAQLNYQFSKTLKALSGMSDIEMLEKNVAVASDEISLTEEDFAKVNKMLSEIENFRELYCTGCEYCLPCPMDIRIPSIFKAYNMANVYGLTDAAKEQYARIADRHETKTASGACIECRACVEKCPQNLDIPELLKKVEATLGK